MRVRHHILLLTALALGGAALAQQPTAEPQTYLSEMGSAPDATGGRARLLHVLPEDMPLAVFVPEAQGNVSDAQRNAVIGAFRAWASAAPDLVSFMFVGKADAAAVAVTWQDLGGSKAGSYRYKTSTRADGQYRFVPTEVILDPSDSAAQLRNFALLEVGHALGLLGRSPYYGDAMSAVPSGTVTARDLSTLRALYALPSGTALDAAQAPSDPAAPAVMTHPN